MSQVGIVILNYNNTKEIIGCIESIITYLPKDKIKCVVVDNGSNDLNREYIHSYLKKNSSYRRLNGGDRCDALEDFSYLCLPKNVGYACGNNAGIDFLNQYESITHIMILNSDIIITEDIVTPLLQQIEQLPNVGALSPLLYTPSGEVDHCCARYNYPIDILKYTFSYLYAKRYKISVGNEILDYILEHGMTPEEFIDGESEKLIYNSQTETLEYGYIHNHSVKLERRKK